MADTQKELSIAPGVVVISEGYWVRDFPGGDPHSLTHDLASPTSENYALYDTLVDIEPIAGKK